MFKACILGLVGFVATASASTHQHIQIDAFNAKNYFNGNAIMTLMQGAVKDITGGRRVADGHVSWEQCKDIQGKRFTIDSSQTYADPDPVKKGIYVTLHLGGFAEEDVEIVSTTIVAVWDGTQLYKDDFPNDQKLGPYETFTTEL